MDAGPFLSARKAGAARETSSLLGATGLPVLRALAVLLASAWVAAPGCFVPHVAMPSLPLTPPPHEEIGIGQPVGVLASLPVPVTPADACGRLRVETSNGTLRTGGHLTLTVRFENCGADPLPIWPYGCGTPAMTPEARGPAYGFVGQGPLLFRGGSCGPMVTGAPTWVVPGANLTQVAWWDGTAQQGCRDPDGWHAPCGTANAPAGRYTLVASLRTADGNASWEATANVTVPAWSESRGNWTEFHPEWIPGPANVTWRNATLPVPEGELVATDGATFLYRSSAVWDLFADAACAPAEPGNATWVRTAAEPCAWARHPSVAPTVSRDP